MKPKLKVAMIYSQWNPVGMYRIHQPAQILKKAGLCDVRGPKFPKRAGGIPWNKKTEESVLKWADIAIFQRRDEPRWIAQMLGAREELRIPVVLETDDYVHKVPTYNPAARHYPPGGEKEKWATAGAELPDAITVSTPGLKKLYNRLNKNVYVLPNSLDMSFWTGFKAPKKDPKKVIVGWCGAGGHLGNLQIIGEPILDVLEKYPHVEFHYVGGLPGCWKKENSWNKPNHPRIKVFPFVSQFRYPEMVAGLKFDIAVAPLRDNFFNRGKSNLRWLEQSINKRCVIGSRVGHYAETIKHKETGILVNNEPDDWFKWLCRLIENKELRETIAENAYQEVRKNWDLEKNIHKWYDCYREIVEKFEYSPIDTRLG